MRLHFVTSLVAATVLAGSSLVGCAVDTDPLEDETESSEEALTARARELVGAFQLASGAGDFTYLVLKQDGSFFTETQIVCITAPCINPRMQGKWSATAVTGSRLTRLTLRPVGQPTKRYYVSVAGDGTSMKLAQTPTSSAALYERIQTYCGAVSDCQGQAVPALRMMCRIGDTMQTFCEANACQARCAPPAPAPECKVDADCRLFDDYCTGCDCRALATSAPAPVCDGPGVRCFRQPCSGRTARCDTGKCVAR